MAMINTTLSNFFAGAAMILNNAQEQPEIAVALDAFGYDTAALQESQALLDAARNLRDAQIKEYGEQHAATQAFTEACQQADKTYAAQRRLAKVAFKSDIQRKTDLHLNDRKP
jgi:fatty acid/phospholipid biosynthesis enzyme